MRRPLDFAETFLGFAHCRGVRAFNFPARIFTRERFLKRRLAASHPLRPVKAPFDSVDKEK